MRFAGSLKIHVSGSLSHSPAHAPAGVRLFLLSATVLLSGCSGGGSENRVDPDGSLHGRVSLSGAFALYPLAVRWADEFRRENPGVRVEIDAGGAGKGVTDALTGQVDFGMLSREPNEAEIAKGAVVFAVAKDAVVPTVSASNPHIDELLRRGISLEAAKGVYVSGDITTWGDLLGTPATERVVVFTRSDACGAAQTWADWLGVKQDDLRGEGLNGDPSLAQAVARDPLATGFNNIGYAYDSNTGKPVDGLRVLPIDVNGNGRIDPEEDFYEDISGLTAAISRGAYPTPPARTLYLVGHGVPTDPVVKAFLAYVLTRGQRLNDAAGYIAISTDEAEKSLTCLGAS